MAQEGSLNDFGLLIAYVVPGFAVTWGVAHYWSVSWLAAPAAEDPTIAGFLNTTVLSVAAGLIVSTLRWMTIDTIHHRTGLRPPRWDFSRLQHNVSAFEVLVAGHYRFYQFYGNMLVAVALVFVVRHLSRDLGLANFDWLDLGFLGLGVILFLGSRDTLRKYYSRTAQLLTPHTVQNKTRTGVSRS